MDYAQGHAEGYVAGAMEVLGQLQAIHSYFSELKDATGNDVLAYLEEVMRGGLWVDKLIANAYTSRQIALVFTEFANDRIH